MNKSEFDCTKILKELVENYNLVGIKTSFEDEGALFEDTIRLKEICNQSDTKLTIKIGGPEAIRDMMDAVTIGIKGMIAPMIESSFALKKFVQSAYANIDNTFLQSIQLGINIETITAVSNIENILDQEIINKLYSLTIGRVDLVSSLNKDRTYVNSDEIYEITKKSFLLAKKYGLKLCVGGAISSDSYQFLQNLYSEGLLDKFETRYAIYDASALKHFNEALVKGQIFEYEWLKSKSLKYKILSEKDKDRILMIQNRINNS